MIKSGIYGYTFIWERTGSEGGPIVNKPRVVKGVLAQSPRRSDWVMSPAEFNRSAESKYYGKLPTTCPFTDEPLELVVIVNGEPHAVHSEIFFEYGSE
jgi:hypothetical protein